MSIQPIALIISMGINVALIFLTASLLDKLEKERKRSLDFMDKEIEFTEEIKNKLKTFFIENKGEIK